MRRIGVAVAIIVILLILTLVAWDFFKPSRHIPQLVAPAARADLVVVEKSARRLSLLRDGKLLRTYNVVLGSDPTGHKQREGDGRTPEGFYKIDFKNQKSRFHLSMRVSYPNAADRQHARQQGVSPGGDIMIHGLPNGLGWLGRLHRARDWTDGCVAATDAEIEEMWALIDVGTAVHIKP